MTDIDALIAARRAQAFFLRSSAKVAEDDNAALLNADALRWQELADNAAAEWQKARE